MFQFLSWVNKSSPDIWKGNKLLSQEQIANIKAALLTSSNEVHESIQVYDRDGNVLYTPLYADFDGAGCDVDVLNYVELIEREFSLTPDIYFSGRKGYHVIINTRIYHSHPHLIAKDFAELFASGAKTLDRQVYASRHMLRSEGSLHLKSGLRKTKISKDMIGNMDEIKKMAREIHLSRELSHHQSRQLNLFIPTIIARVEMAKKIEDEKYAATVKENNGEISPCIRSLIAGGPIPGQNNAIITLIARNMNSIGMDRDDAINHMMAHEQWSSLSREIKSTFVSIWKRPSKFGCHKETILKERCDPFCIFNSYTLGI